MALQRPTFSRIEAIDAVQVKGWGSPLWAVRNSSIAAIRSGTLWKTPRRIALSVSSRNQRSTRLSQELEVGVVGAVEGLDLALLIDAQHERLLRGIEVEADDVGELLCEARVVGELERLDSV